MNIVKFKKGDTEFLVYASDISKSHRGGYE